MANTLVCEGRNQGGGLLNKGIGIFIAMQLSDTGSSEENAVKEDIVVLLKPWLVQGAIEDIEQGAVYVWLWPLPCKLLQEL